ncbi:hypothetical protein [Pantoea agglomerans]|uniref:hypothetical protein n=1 Tax=Enterobacter agglomerans TaxID=549 RepID=UPI003EBD0E5D
MTDEKLPRTSEPKKIPSRIAIGMAFLTTFIYAALFLWFKHGNAGGALLLLNIVYAAYAFFTLLVDRKSRFSDLSDARLVTLGTGLAPVAVSIMDALLTYQKEIQQSSAWLLLLSFLIVFIIWFAMMLVASAIPTDIKDKIKKPARSSNGN